MMTIRDLVMKSKEWLAGKGAGNPRLDAELLIADGLGITRLELFLTLDKPVGDQERVRCRERLVRRGNLEPIAYILGEREFYGHKILVDKRVLIPRPETEHLVEEALLIIEGASDAHVVDACTGSGCVAIALLHERPHIRMTLTDKSEDACAVAKSNLDAHGFADRATVLCTDLLEGVDECAFVVGNPPYVMADEELMPDVGRHEPHMALFGEGPTALGHHQRLIDQAAALGAKAILLEFGFGQKDAIAALDHKGFGQVKITQDLAQIPRIAAWHRVLRD